MLSQVHFHMSREFASRSMGSLCFGIVDVTGDLRWTDMSVNMIVIYCNVGVDVAVGCMSSVCDLVELCECRGRSKEEGLSTPAVGESSRLCLF